MAIVNNLTDPEVAKHTIASLGALAPRVCVLLLDGGL